MGSISKRGDVYYIRYELPPNPDGTRRQKMESCKGLNKKQAEEKLRRIESSVYGGTYVEETTLSLEDFLKEWFLRKRTDLSPTTWEEYGNALRLYVYPIIGHHKLGKLTPGVLQKWIDGLSTRLSAKTVKNVHGIVRTALESAVRLQMIGLNPAARVDLPRYRRPEIVTADQDGMAALIKAIEGTIYEIPIWIILATGMRRSEVVGLKWEDYNEARGTIIVRRNKVEVRGYVIVKGTKTERPRIVGVPLILQEKLKTYRKTLESDGTMDEWLCGSLTPNALEKGFGRVKRQLGLKFTLHGLRHTQASELGMSNIPVALISQRLGHTEISTTQNIYTHVLPHKDDASVNVIEAMLRKAKEKAEGNNPSA